ncbi:MAG TPA: iron ABC transporter permease [Acidimicrobiia bacterium]
MIAPTGVFPPKETPREGRRAASPLLWALGLAAVVPAAIPIGYLVWTVVRPGGFDAGGFSAERLLDLLAATALLAVTVTIATAVLGLATAWITTRTDLPGARIWSTLVTLPLVIPSYVGAMTMLAASGNNGMLSQLLGELGLPPLPVFQGFWAVWVALSLWNFSFVHLLIVPVLRRLDPALEEASRGLGASRWRTIRTIVIPQLRPALASSSLLVALYVISEFGAVSMLRYETFTRAIYTQFGGRLDPTPALFLAGLLVIGALVVVLIQQWARGKAALYSSRPARPVATVRLGRWGKLGAWGFLGALVTLALILPMATLMWWAVRGLMLGNSPLPVLSHAARSLSVSAVAAAVIVVAAIPVSILAVRFPGKRSRALESTAWLTYSLPHLAIGLGFLVLAVRIARPIYQTLLLLVIAYLAMFLPQAMASLESGLRRIGPHLEEVSRSLGVGGWTTLRRVTIPLIRRSALAGAALVFLSVMKELPATLLLRPTEFDTLAVRIWSATSELFYTQASFASLTLVAVSFLPLYLFVARDLHR